MRPEHARGSGGIEGFDSLQILGVRGVELYLKLWHTGVNLARFQQLCCSFQAQLSRCSCRLLLGGAFEKTMTHVHFYFRSRKASKEDETHHLFPEGFHNLFRRYQIGRLTAT